MSRNRKPCDDKNSDCGNCIENYVAVDTNDNESPCVKRFMPVPVAAELKGIDLNTRVNRKKLQAAFRAMIAELNNEMTLRTNNFKTIDLTSVFLVGVTLFHLLVIICKIQSHLLYIIGFTIKIGERILRHY